MKDTSVEKIRVIKDIPIKTMAEQLGLSERQYRRYAKGETPWTLDLIDRAAVFFKMTPMEVLSFDERYIFHQCTNHHVLGSHNTYHESGPQERETSKAYIKHLEDEIRFLQKQLEDRSSETRA